MLKLEGQPPQLTYMTFTATKYVDHDEEFRYQFTFGFEGYFVDPDFDPDVDDDGSDYIDYVDPNT